MKVVEISGNGNNGSVIYQKPLRFSAFTVEILGNLDETWTPAVESSSVYFVLSVNKK